jgi:hypothetical protein
MARPPRLPDAPRRLERITDAEWTEVHDSATRNEAPTGPRSCLKTGLILVGGVLIGFVALTILVVMFAGHADFEAPSTASGATISATAEDPLPLTQAGSTEAEIEDELCSDEMTLAYLHDVSRAWLRGVLNGMVVDGVLILPAVEDPLDRMVAHANIDWVGGPPTYVDGQIVGEGVYVTCRARIVFRDAIMLPDGSWSDAEVTIPDATFDLSAADANDVIRVELIVGEPDEAMDMVTITVAGTTMSLAQFYDFTLGNTPR